MLSLLEKSLYLGFGIFSYSREKIEKIVEELVEKGDVKKQDAQKMVSDLVKKGREQREELEKMVREEIIKSIDYMNIARKQDLITKEEIRDIIREELNKALK
jgi:polyhydroxyalkanoate synthesis regulator phasin